MACRRAVSEVLIASLQVSSMTTASPPELGLAINRRITRVLREVIAGPFLQNSGRFLIRASSYFSPTSSQSSGDVPSIPYISIVLWKHILPVHRGRRLAVEGGVGSTGAIHAEWQPQGDVSRGSL